MAKILTRFGQFLLVFDEWTTVKFEHWIWSRDTGQQIPCFDRCQFIDHNMDVQYQRSKW